jgi:hypothetical protein
MVTPELQAGPVRLERDAQRAYLPQLCLWKAKTKGVQGQKFSLNCSIPPKMHAKLKDNQCMPKSRRSQRACSERVLRFSKWRSDVQE